MPARRSPTASWKRRLRRDIGWLLLAKLCALTALWALFFSPAQRPSSDASAVADRLALAAPPSAPESP